MKIKSLLLFSNDLLSQKSFYQKTLGLELQYDTSESFTIHMGWTNLTFKKSVEKYVYHYCFLLPSNKFDIAYDWFKNNHRLIELDGKTEFEFLDWNAKSFYFYDGNNNIAECIVRYDLDNPSPSNFDISDLLCVNEIGMPSSDIKYLNNSIESSMESYFWKGDFERFATNGDNNGLFLLVNNEVKTEWFPTSIPTQKSPFKAVIEANNSLYNLTFSDDEFNIVPKVLVH